MGNKIELMLLAAMIVGLFFVMVASGFQNSMSASTVGQMAAVGGVLCLGSMFAFLFKILAFDAIYNKG